MSQLSRMDVGPMEDDEGNFLNKDESIIILSDNESVYSKESADLFESDENSRDDRGLNEYQDSPSNVQVDLREAQSEPNKCGFPIESGEEEGVKISSNVSQMEKNVSDARSFVCFVFLLFIMLDSRYMQLKKEKLRYQVNVLDYPSNCVSNIFNGVSIFVNGYTDPSALELRQLIQIHGGEYHCYYEYGVTKFIIATSLASAKISKMRREEKIVKPEWIVDCIAAGKLLEVDKYLLLSTQKKNSISAAFCQNMKKEEVDEEPRILDARDPNFLEQYYARSRLHLISTLAQEMKDYVVAMRSDDSHSFIGREALLHLTNENYQSSPGRIIFHVDLDCFFVSVALRNRPDLLNKPVAVTHSKGVSGGFSELASVSYAARQFGVKNGMIVRDAIKLCPNLICLPYLFEDYRIIAKTIYTMVARYTLEIKAVSCDEMYIDCTKLLDELRISDPEEFAQHLREEIRRETGCPASVGIGRSPLIARLATRHAKPDGVYFVLHSETEFFIAKEKVKNLPGMGHHNYSKIIKAFGNVERCSDLQTVSKTTLESVLGRKVADQVYKMCRAEDDEKDFVACNMRKSISCDINYGIRFTKKSEVFHFLRVVAQELEKKLRQAKMVASSVTLKLMVRSSDAPMETAKYLGHGKCDLLSKSSLLEHPTACSQVITMIVLKLFAAISPVVPDIRGIGVQCGRVALVSDVGYSIKSEAISRMFRKRKPKKECREMVQHEESRKDLPLAFNTQPPSFFGEHDVSKVNEELVKYLNNEPQEDTVGVVTDFLFYLLRDGCLSTLTSTCLMLHRELYSFEKKTDPGWLFAVNFIFNSLDEICRKMYGAVMIRPAIECCIEF
ncbi:BRCA1 protein [Dictyocaulus viviparus]|uniref:DNA repair protein REV1 n=1 Tax=Dictyocaulus viviparus TaxID=29172 RepID=A0A0D8Y2S3_DICVI|nr:BRCA1 protein [Dictyocaulus viviparus]